jgi:quercetin dioxygenase-like cupin family protein
MEVHRTDLAGAASISIAERGFRAAGQTRAIESLGASADGSASHIEVMAVHFGAGEVTGVHRHMGGQVLVVLDGHARVETDEERVVAGPGDIVIAAPGEWHRHGASDDGPMTHLAIHPQGDGLTERRTEPAS